MVDAVNISSDVNVQGYNFENNVNVSSLTFNSSELNITGWGSDPLDCWGEVNGVVGGAGLNGIDCVVPKNVGVIDVIYIRNIIDVGGNVSFLNQSGNFSVHSIDFNTTGGGNISLFKLDNISDECYYGTSSLNIEGYVQEFNNTKHFQDCNITFFVNDSAISKGTLNVASDGSIRDLVLATATAGVSIIVIYKAVDWDSVS